MAKKPYNAYAFPHGKEIKAFHRGSWQEAEHKRGRQFYEPIPPAERLRRDPVDQQLPGQVGEILVAAVVEQTVELAVAG